VIGSFADEEARKIHSGVPSRRFLRAIQRVARRKLIYLDDAENLRDLFSPPGNQLEKLKGDRQGQYSIRINDQWRICFDWTKNQAESVEITDYHS
jgi:proteic killer suppression protein